ncbi:MAG: tRNA (N6-threonylcarbamoyladenosine(37)-N6)-methyltransferase TrmO [Marinifilaceae bacterium]
MIVLDPIGFVHNNYANSTVPEFIKKDVSCIEILPEYAEGLQNVNEAQYLDMIFYFHKEKRTELITRVRTGEMKGVFASRSPKRPNHLGVTTVKIVKIEANKIYVEGADALDGTPVVDLKHCDTSLFQRTEVHDDLALADPRLDIIREILNNDKKALLARAAPMHGHVCPGLAIGIVGGTELMRRLYAMHSNPDGYTLVANMAKCPLDGAIFVTGCTPGRGKLTLGNPDDMSISLVNADGHGWKATLRKDAKEQMDTLLPKEGTKVEKGMACAALDYNVLFDVVEV